MRLSEMEQLVRVELTHIPKGPTGSAQQLLRAVYPMQRKHDLKLDPATGRSDSLATAVVGVQHSDPAFCPEYDAEFFA
jgi:hypothetical protein